MATMSYLTDVIGPRLTGSPNMKRANEWTRDKLAAWGLANAHLEAWGPFGRGWTLKRFSAQVIAPQCIPLIGYPKAWSPGTEGTLEAPVVYFDAKTEAEFAKFKGKLKGAIVLVSPIREVAAHFEPLATRKTDSELLALADAAEPNPRAAAAGARPPRARARCRRRRSAAAGRPAAPAAAGAAAAAAAAAGRRCAGPAGADGAIHDSRDAWPSSSCSGRRPSSWPTRTSPCSSSRATRATAARSSSSRRASPARARSAAAAEGGGQAPRVTVYSKDAPKIIPQVVLAKEHYNRLVRMCEAGEKRQDGRRAEGPVPRRRPDVLQHRRRDPRHRSEARAGHAGRAHGFLAQRHRRDRQRRRRIGRHGGGAHPQGARLEAAANDPHRALER